MAKRRASVVTATPVANHSTSGRLRAIRPAKSPLAYETRWLICQSYRQETIDDGRWTMDDGVRQAPGVSRRRPSSIVHRPSSAYGRSSTVTFVMGSPLAIALTTSIPSITWPKFVYSPSRNRESLFTMKYWQSLLRDLSGPRATPNAPALNGRLLYSAGILLPPLPVPVGSPPWITQSSTLWNFK